MRHIPLTLLFLFLVLVSCQEQARKQTSSGKADLKLPLNLPVFNQDSAFLFVKAQTDFGPRVNNTEAHRKCATYLTSTLQRFSRDVTVQQGTVRGFDGKMLEFQNIIASFGPVGNNRILLAAHWDSRPWADHDPDPANFNTPIDGANDGASGVGVLLEIARVLSQNPPPVGVDIILFDAEDYGPPESLQQGPSSTDHWGLGSQYWAKKPHREDYYCKDGILLDMVGAADATFFMEGVSMEYAPSVVKRVWDIGNQLGYSSYFLYQPGGYITDDHYFVIRDRGIPMIDIIHLDPTTESGMYRYWHTVEDNLDKISPATLKAVGQTVITVLYSEK